MVNELPTNRPSGKSTSTWPSPASAKQSPRATATLNTCSRIPTWLYCEICRSLKSCFTHRPPIGRESLESASVGPTGGNGARSQLIELFNVRYTHRRAGFVYRS